MDSRARYDGMLSDYVGPWLRGRGFRKNRNEFRRAVAGGWNIVDFQASQFGSRHGTKSTVNLATAYPELRGAQEQWTARRAPPAYAAHLQERIGGLTPEREDLWWEVETSTSLDHVAADVRTTLTEFGLPWLLRRTDFQALEALVETAPEELSSQERSRLPLLHERAGRLPPDLR